MTRSFRRQDMRAESKLAEFMDSYLYDRMKPNDKGEALRYERESNPQEQRKGVDVCIEAKGKKYYIDEKASIYYSNAMIPTFAFEIDSMQEGYENPVEGWFINDNLLTEFYMLIWPNVKCDSKKGWARKDIATLEKNDFTILETMLVSKKRLREKMEQYGYNREQLREYAQEIRALNCTDDKYIEKPLKNGMKIRLTTNLKEKPINLIIPKRILKEVAERRYFVSQEGYALIRE